MSVVIKLALRAVGDPQVLSCEIYAAPDRGLDRRSATDSRRGLKVESRMGASTGA